MVFNVFFIAKFCNVCTFINEPMFAIDGGSCMLFLRRYCQKNSGLRTPLMYDTRKAESP